MIREFEAFLYRYRAVGAFITNLGCNFETYVQSWIDKPLKSNTLVSAAFDWNATPEGWAYWAGIDKQWRDHFCRKYATLSEKTTANV
jgi:hypothetical protein